MPEEQTQSNEAPMQPETALLSAPPQRLLLPKIAGAVMLMLSVFGAGTLASLFVPAWVKGVFSSTQVASVPVALDTSRFDTLSLQAKSVYVYDASTDTLLFSRAPDAQLPLASITKVMLSLVVSEVLSSEDTITISREAVERGGGGLTHGEVWRMRDLLDYMLIASSNTAAEALKEAAEPRMRERYPQFREGRAVVSRMNALAQELGMRSTYFLNASGLDESGTQAGAYGSARDVALMFEYALQEKRELFAGTAREHATLGAQNMPKQDVLNTNIALTDIPHIYMGKTGLTDLAGGNLAIAYDAGENYPVITVVLGSTQEARFTDMQKLVGATLETLLKKPSVGTVVQ